MAAFGSFTFDGVVGVIVPSSTKTVTPLDNPGQVQAAERRIGQFQPSSLFYNGWFEESQKDALYATAGSTLTAEDETGEEYTVLVVGLSPPREIPAQSADGTSVGVWCEVTVSVQAWS